jgi:murein DD-endopeptidase MepM/ murein hydrolase activator NlpD
VSMNRRTPKRYTILISCTGQQPVVVSFRPAIAFLTLMLGAGLPIVVMLTLLYSYASRNMQLAQRNSQLTEEASSILKRLELLEDKVGTLKEPPVSSQSGTDSQSSNDAQSGAESRSGAESQNANLESSLQSEPEVMLSVARDKIPSLLQLLQTTAEPLTEKDLIRDAARPRGLPILGDAKISSPFGLQPSSQWGYELHQGIDLTAAYGSPIQATASGFIEEAGWDDQFGNRIVINHGYGYRTLYAHLSKIAVTSGTSVKRDQMIGYLGDSERSTAPHLHYGIYRNGFVVDPKDYLN